MLSKMLKKTRKQRGLGVNELGRQTGLSPSYLSALERGKKTNPSIEILEKISAVLKVTVSRLTGEAAINIIENRLEELGMSLSELTEKSKVPLIFFQNLDSVIPDNDGDSGEQYYSYMTQIAKVLVLPSGTLRAAFARQEIPLDQYPKSHFDDLVIKERRKEPASKILEVYPAKNFVKIPVIGTVMAGPNGLAYEDYQGEEWVDANQINGGHYFYLKIKGDSMIGDGILPGDLALVRETPEVNYGALAIAIVNDNEGTIKRVYQNEDSIILQASNPSYPPLIFAKDEMENVRIIGEVKMTMRNY